MAHAHTASWLSLGFEDLLHSAETGAGDLAIDILIVGSGYGGAIAAAHFAGARDAQRKLRVCVLERGKEYLPGSFPTGADELAGHVRMGRADSAIPAGRAEGLFDVRTGPDVNVLVYTFRRDAERHADDNEIFRELCTQSNAKGNLVPDAYLAALAIEHECELITTDRDFARFSGATLAAPASKKLDRLRASALLGERRPR